MPAISSSSPARSPSIPPPSKLITGDIATETRQVLNNIKAMLEGCGATLADVVKCGVYPRRRQRFRRHERGLRRSSSETAKPARTTVLWPRFAVPGIQVEIDAIAYKPE